MRPTADIVATSNDPAKRLGVFYAIHVVDARRAGRGRRRRLRRRRAGAGRRRLRAGTGRRRRRAGRRRRRRRAGAGRRWRRWRRQRRWQRAGAGRRWRRAVRVGPVRQGQVSCVSSIDREIAADDDQITRPPDIIVAPIHKRISVRLDHVIIVADDGVSSAGDVSYA
jgi:hypothetical protein